MIIVVPVCYKDNHLVQANLEWCIRLEEQTKFHALIAVEEGTVIPALLDAASKVFTHVTTYVYSAYTGKPEWPMPQNYAFQTVARHMATLTHPDSWFWWEADVVPLRAGWLNALEEEYQRGGKPFMGRIGDNGMGGVAVYPPNVIEHTMDAMLCRASSFDSMLWKDIKHKTHAANHLMAHFPRYNCVRVHVSDPVVPRRLLAKGYVIFHGCNDGSLVEVLQGRTPKPAAGGLTRLYTPEDVDAEPDDAEPMWQHDALELEKRGYPVLPFRECVRDDIPSIIHQTEWPCGMFALPLDASQCHYNPGLVRNGDLFLVTRRWLRNQMGGWKSSMIRWKLDADLFPVEPLELQVSPRDSTATYEDPRIIFHDGRYWVSYCVWRQGRLFRSHQSFSSFNTTWQHLGTTNVPYGFNGWNVGSGSGHEKNWVWFRHDRAWHFVYQFSPHIVVRADQTTQLREYKVNPTSMVPWLWGEVHGGTPPVRVGDEYITFFHSSLAWRGRKKRYYMGAYAFSAKPPFGVTRLTREPLLRGSDKDTRTLGGPLVVFPCGAVLEGGEWLVSLGVNDEACAWIRIPHADLTKRLEPL